MAQTDFWTSLEEVIRKQPDHIMIEEANRPFLLSDRYEELKLKVDPLQKEIIATQDPELKRQLMMELNNIQMTMKLMIDLIHKHGDLDHADYFYKGIINPKIKTQ